MSAERTKGLGLGRGLGALLGDAALQTQSGGSVTLPITQVEPGLNQPRKRFEDEPLAALADSVRTHGILQPLTVRRLASGYYQIIAGERRWRAARLAGLTEVPALIIEADDRKVMELGLIENLQREDLNPMEEAAGYRTLMQEHGLTQEETARRVGKSRPAVANALRLLTLPDDLQAMVEEGILSAGHARTLLPLAGDQQYKAAKAVLDRGLSVRQTEELVKKLQADEEEEAHPKPPTPADPAALYLRESERTLGHRLGRKVRIVPGRRKGRVELEFYDRDDLEALLDALERTGRGGGRTP